MPTGPEDLTADALAFLAERHHGTFASLRADGSIHATAVGFTFDPDTGLARVITSGTSQKARNATGGVAAALTQVDGARWLTLEGTATTVTDPDAIAEAVARYAVRYRQPRENPQRVAILLQIARVLGSPKLLGR